MALTSPTNFIVLFFMLALSACANAELLVSISQQNPSAGILVLYPEELANLTITAVNIGNAPESGYQMRASVDTGLVIIDKGVETSAMAFEVPELGPQQKGTFAFTVKAKDAASGKRYAYVHYGKGEFTNLAATYISVKESPLRIDASLKPSGIDRGGRSSLNFRLENTGDTVLQDVNVEIIVPQKFNIESTSLHLDALVKGTPYENGTFAFVADPGVMGSFPITLGVSFMEGGQPHFIAKDFTLSIKPLNPTFNLEIIAALVIAAIALFAFSRMKGKEEKQGEK